MDYVTNFTRVGTNDAVAGFKLAKDKLLQRRVHTLNARNIR